MPVRHHPRRRYRIMLWLDSATNVESWSLATYVDDEKQSELVSTPEPFDRPDAVAAALVRNLEAQLNLW